MKYLTSLLFIIFCFVKIANAQNPPPPPSGVATAADGIFTKVDVEASFTGGEVEWRKYLTKNLNVDKVALKVKFPRRQKEFRQTIIVKFIVNKQGEISSVTAENEDADPYCIAEAIRVIKDSPKWVPAQQNGRIVNAYRRQPITFIFER
jgi:periplasmic protein TonB